MMMKTLAAAVLISAVPFSAYAQNGQSAAPSQYGSQPQAQGNQPVMGSEAVPTADPGVTNSVTDNQACQTGPATSAQRPKTPGSQAEPQPQARCGNKK
jgi:hypothetical protein